MILLADSFLCPGNEYGAHITTNSTCCECGNSNICSLAKILDRVEVVERIVEEIAYDGICCDLPTLRAMERES